MMKYDRNVLILSTLVVLVAASAHAGGLWL